MATGGRKASPSRGLRIGLHLRWESLWWSSCYFSFILVLSPKPILPLREGNCPSKSDAPDRPNDSICLFNSLNFRQPPFVPFFIGETSTQECLHQIFGKLRADDARTEDQNVHVVMLHALMRRIRIVADRGANAFDL